MIKTKNISLLKKNTSFLSHIWIDNILTDNTLENIGKESQIVVFDTIEYEVTRSGKHLLNFSYRTYDVENESGGYLTNVNALCSDADIIIDNLNHLIFDVIAYKKKSYKYDGEVVNLSVKTNNNVSDKWRYHKRFGNKPYLKPKY